MTAEQELERLEELEAKATKGPWTVELDYNICHGYEYKDGKHTAKWVAQVDYQNQEDIDNLGYSNAAEGDAEFIVALRNEALKALRTSIEEVKRARARQMPEVLTDPIKEILGLPNYMTGPTAHVLRDLGGWDIAPKMEVEQAVVLHWLLGIAFEHGGNWREVAVAYLKGLKEAKAQKDAEEATNV